MGLARYHKKRDFHATSEPKGATKATPGRSFVIQKHAASRLHYDFRLEHGGVLKSWAVPKGPSLSPGEKRLAVEVEDHPVDYADFEGNIPKGQYGGGAVIVWDRGEWQPEGDVREGLAKGTLKFSLDGEKLHGRWMLVRLKDRDDARDGKHNWLLIKEHDEFASDAPSNDVTATMPKSVVSQRTIDEVAREKNGRIWNSNRDDKSKSREVTTAKPLARTKRSAVARLDAGEKAPLPRDVKAELATLVDAPPDGPDWLFEIKFDGYRILATVEKKHAVLVSRNGKDWSERFPTLRDAIAKLPVQNAIFDGEVCFEKASGTTDFQSLQNVLSEGGEDELVYFVFDVLYLNGRDLRSEPLVRRKEILAEVLRDAPSGPIRLSEHVEGKGGVFFGEACRIGLEGIIAKRADSPYIGKRTLDWQKIKCSKRQELTIIGYTPPKGGRKGLGALLLGVHDKGKLRYAGKVGTGFTQASLQELYTRLHKMEVPESPAAGAPRLRTATWVRPELVGEVQFTEWTRDGSLRHPSFLGLREDKPATEVVREEPVQAKRATKQAPAKKAATTKAPANKAATTKAPAKKKAATKTAKTASPTKSGEIEIAGVRITHPDRVLDAESGLTKQGLAEYYAEMGSEILRYAKRRPLALVRCPEGTAGEKFFQKHKTAWMGDGIEVAKVGDDDVLYVASKRGIVQLAQVSAFELHGWGSTLDSPETPDLFVMDLDPDEGLPWARVASAAFGLRERLLELGFKSFVKTTGGKGLHVVVPIAPEYDWETVKGFTEALALDFVHRDPKAFTATMAKKARTGKIFIDYLRNGRGATAILPYSPRARPGVPVAMPITWDEVETVVPAEINIQTASAFVKARKTDPWAGMQRLRQRLTAGAIEKLEAARRR